nr:hypothetical protein [Ruminococcus bromii]
MGKYIVLLIVSMITNVSEIFLQILELYYVRYIVVLTFVIMSVAFIIYDKTKKNIITLSSGTLVLVSVLFVINIAIAILSDLLLTSAGGSLFLETVNSIAGFSTFLSLYLLCEFFMNLINIKCMVLKIILYTIISVNLIVLLIRAVAVLFGVYIGNNFTIIKL